MMVSSFHDGPSQASSMPGVPMHMPLPMDGFHNADPSPSTGPNYQYSQHHQQQQSVRRKRKADSQDANNERLSKRLSLLNLGKICGVFFNHYDPDLYFFSRASDASTTTC